MKNITLVKKKTTVSITNVDGWVYDLKYTVNGRETYSCQLLKTDVANRIKRLEAEGFTRMMSKKEAREFIEFIEKSC